MVKYGFGVDIGGTTCKLGLFSLEGELLEKWEIPTDTADGGVGILSDVADAVEQKLKERQIPRDEVLGIGLDAPGAIGEDGVVSQAVNLGWRQYPARDVLSQRMNMKVRICNDANAAALGEQWKGGGAGCLDMVMVTLGTGVGGAVIAGGKVIGGAHGIAGEIGHMIVYAGETERCACGRYGCLGQYASRHNAWQSTCSDSGSHRPRAVCHWRRCIEGRRYSFGNYEKVLRAGGTYGGQRDGICTGYARK